VSARGREWLGITIAEQRQWRTEYQPIAGWIAALETRGVLVFQTGAVEVDEMRGFSLTARELPAIVVNAKDAPRGRVFTLMHEFCHLLLDRGGVCDPVRVGREGRSPDENVEIFCNRVAGALLVPRDALLEDPRVETVQGAPEWEDEVLRALASDFGVSREVILRRLLVLGKTTGEFYERKRAEYLAQYAANAARMREAGGFVPPSRLALRDNGRRYTGLVLEALERERITAADVTDYLGMRLKHLDDIAQALRRAAAEA
jgi:Zn-dependent peptidase ImmA (M78 family)